MDLFLQTRDPQSLAIFALVVLWIFFWKGLALWHASRRDQRMWFVILLIISTLGIIEIIYLFFVIKLKPSDLFKNEKIKGGADSEANEGK
ncbi:MAG TPA: DUF5652 family protein [Candidatus Paceibacterota bacterium]|nr:DUF5652 family protein [Candidatus Paceibacterota bacterium]